MNRIENFQPYTKIRLTSLASENYR